MPQYAYRLLNVFTIDDDKFSGNPLCVFENAQGLAPATMQALALQFNLSETAFIFPSSRSRADAHVRIFSPMFELPFAGHPILGTAEVVRSMGAAKGQEQDTVRLELPIGVLEVTASGNTWTLRAGDPKARKVEAARIELASMLGLEVDEIAERTLWVNTGVEQLIVPLTSKAALERVRPAPELLQRHAQLSADRYLVYVYTELGEDRVRARFFFKKGMSVVEDPATGSACANLGGYFVTTQARLPLQRTIEQGQHTGRPSRLMLRVDAQSRIFVSGAVLELGRGSVTL